MISIHRKNARKYDNEDRLASGWEAFPVRDAEHLSRAMVKFPWSPITWKNGYRSSSNFIATEWLALDFDDGEMTVGEAVENVFCDMTHVIGLTKSHQVKKKTAGGSLKQACDRFRVVLKLEKAVSDLHTYTSQIIALSRHLPIDSKCKDGGRFFSPCTEIVSIETDGLLQKVIPPPRKGVAKGPSKFEKKGILTPRVSHILDHFRIGNRSNDCVLLGKYLSPFGYDLEDIFKIVTATKCVQENPLNHAEVKDLKHSISQGIKYATKSLEDNK